MLYRSLKVDVIGSGVTMAATRCCRSGAPRGRNDLGDELVGHIENLVRRQRRRLLNEVKRAGIETTQHTLARLRRDADDDDRHRPNAICRRMNSTPSTPGMIRSQVTTSGRSRSTMFECLLAIAGRADDLDDGLRDSISLTTLRM